MLVGVIKMVLYEEERKKVLEIALKILHSGEVIGTAGNVSMRIKPKTEEDEELYAITPSSMDYDELDVEDYEPSVKFDDIEEPPPRTEECVVFDDGDSTELVEQLVNTLKEKGLNLGAYK